MFTLVIALVALPVIGALLAALTRVESSLSAPVRRAEEPRQP